MRTNRRFLAGPMASENMRQLRRWRLLILSMIQTTQARTSAPSHPLPATRSLWALFFQSLLWTQWRHNQPVCLSNQHWMTTNWAAISKSIPKSLHKEQLSSRNWHLLKVVRWIILRGKYYQGVGRRTLNGQAIKMEPWQRSKSSKSTLGLLSRSQQSTSTMGSHSKSNKTLMGNLYREMKRNHQELLALILSSLATIPVQIFYLHHSL